MLRLLAWVCALANLGLAAAQTPPTETTERVLPVEVLINKGAGGIWPIVSRGEVLYAPTEAFTGWRLIVRPDTPVMNYRGFRYYPLTAVQGLQARLDADKGTLELTVGAEAFNSTRLTRELGTPVLARSKVVPALFLNYDINFSSTAGTVNASGLGLIGEFGWSTDWGVLTQTFVGRDLVGATGRQVKRLETTFRHDFPDQGYTVNLGDSISRTGLLGRGAYFGGVQFGTNFNLAPYLNRQPIPVVAGETSTPSTVQLYVNDVLRQTSNVPAGPFTLDNLPPLTGNGEVSIRVRDILGRETVIRQPFFITAELLGVGVNDWSVEAGKLRRDLGVSSAHYATPFTTGLWRRGLTPTMTGETRLELSRTRSGMGLAAVQAFGADWLARAGWSSSRDDSLGTGQRWLVGVDKPSYRSNFAVSLEGNTRSFRSLGEDLATVPPRYQLAAQASYFGDWGRVGATIAVQQTYDRPSVRTYSLNYGTTLLNNVQVEAYLTQSFGSVRGYTLGTMLTVPFDRRTMTSTSLQKQNGRAEFYTSVTHTADGPTGLAWRALAARQAEPKAEGGLFYTSNFGVFSGEVAVRPRQVDARLGAAGSLLYTENHAFALQRFDSSAALVEVPGYPGVGVSMGAAAGLRTDGSGYILINRLAPYQKNPIRLDANDLPISAEIDSIEQEAVPPWRSVAKLEFDVRGGQAALVTIRLDDGEPAPPGAVVRIEGGDREFYVARRGEAYVTGLKGRDRLQLSWRDATCKIDLNLPPGAPDDIPRVGPVACTGVPR